MASALCVKDDPKCVCDVRALLGEGPVWVEEQNCLFWVDIKRSQIFSLHAQTGDLRQYDTPGMTSALAHHHGSVFIAAGRDGFSKLTIESDQIVKSHILDPESAIATNRFNDGDVAPDGSFWSGTMDQGEDKVTGSWWRLDASGNISHLLSGFTVTNGPAFCPTDDKVYLTDSARRQIFVARTQGSQITDLKKFLSFGDTDGYPDGMEVDAEGFLWVAFWDGGCVRRFDEKGQCLETVALPVPRPTSLTLVRNKLYITSASIGLSDDERLRYPYSGGVFEVTLNKELGRTKNKFGSSLLA